MTGLLLIIIYLSFISLGLPDSLLGSAWPTMYGELSVPISYAGIISMLVALNTIISSLFSARLTARFGTGAVTAASVGLSAAALFGFSVAPDFWWLCILAVPYGLGAGGVDAAINNYVALHYPSRHMSWLHAMWGVGTIIGPNVIGYALTHGMSWQEGYSTISVAQTVLVFIILISLPLWKRGTDSGEEKRARVLSLKEIFALKGAKAVCVTFFCYCALEQTAMLWAASYLNLHCGLSSESAASAAASFFIGITAGRIICGFLTSKFNDKQLIIMGMCIIAGGIALMLLPFGTITALIGIVIIGLGCAPIYPSIMHSIPTIFGEELSGSVIGVQMASAYTGTLLMPPLFGLIANHISVALFPLFLLFFFVLMAVMYRKVLKNSR